MLMSQRLPNFQAIVPVYAVTAAMLAGWTITAFLWKISAWLLLLTLGEILTIFAYAMVTNFLESLIILGLLLLICILLPRHLLRDHFAVRGTILALGMIGALMAFVGLHMRFGIESGASLFLGPAAVLVFTAVLLGLSARAWAMGTIQSAVLWISDRLIVFLILLMPMFLMSSLYVVYRNIT
jgi:hypothetical protein